VTNIDADLANPPPSYIDVTDQTFEAEVLDRSTEVPVVVDLWAPWCGPCRSLGPIIEKVVGDTDGRVVLAKVNVDDNPGVSQAFQVQGIPAVYALVDRKVVNGSTVVILDGGVHHVLRPALVGQEHRVRLVGKPSPLAKARPVTVAGPLCTGLDVIAAGALLTPPDPGDLLAVLDVGAYGYTESMPWFLSHPVPPEVVIQGGRSALIRPRVEPESWLNIQRLPDFTD
jgi:thiol-disulfide isomerase/thioredoxin